ncbi:MAG: KH domain-containing protein [Patescibacteria group bacterium]
MNLDKNAWFSNRKPCGDIDIIVKILETLTKAIVENPGAVRVTKSEGSRILLIELRVVREDMGRVIGKNGRTIKTLNWIAEVLSRGCGKRAQVDLLPPRAG